MHCVIIGGKLQGVEAAYLAAKAGWEITIIDKTPDAPASGLGHRFVSADVQNASAVKPILKNADLIVPAMENDSALGAIADCARSLDIPLAFDPEAYAISSSKLKSDRLFKNAGIRAPRYWPDCPLPVVAKPSTGSGSSGVQIFNTADAVNLHIRSVKDDWVVQEFLQGPTYSIEVIGRPGRYTVFQVTDLGMDPGYDCSRVIAPTDLDPSLISRFNDLGVALAQAVALEGIMDVEVILHDQKLKVLEIDARLPSQTPTAVFCSTGVNLLQVLGESTLSGTVAHFCPAQQKGVVYEHIRVSPGLIEVLGEHIMATGGPLHMETNFFGADEAITNHVPGAAHWVATLITTASDRKKALARNRAVKNRICKETGISRILDEGPEAIGGTS